MSRMPPEQVVRFGYRMVAADPGIDPRRDVVELQRGPVRERQRDPDARRRLPRRRAIDAATGEATRRIAARALDAIACPGPAAARPARSIRAGRLRRGRAGRSPVLARTHLPRHRSRAADGGARSLAGRGRRLVRRGGGAQATAWSTGRRTARSGIARCREPSTSMSCSASQSAVRPNAMVPPRDGARDGQRAVLAERHGRVARHQPGARQVHRHLRRGDVGHDKVEPPVARRRAGPPWRGAPAARRRPSPMMESALTAIADSFSAAVAARTRFSRVRGRHHARPGCRRTRGRRGCPRRPASAFDRTDTGTITRSARPRVGSPRASSRSCSPPPTAAEHDVVDRSRRASA